jgi:hypothetical protein
VNQLQGCKIAREASPDFRKFVKHWQRSHPHIEGDISEAFSEIEKNILANRGRRVYGGSRFDLYKYRQNSKDIRRGSSYGWRIYALFDRQSKTMYPIIVYPKTTWEDADGKTILESVNNLKLILGHCTRSECDGTLCPAVPEETSFIGGIPHDKLYCVKCRTIAWREQSEHPALPS